MISSIIVQTSRQVKHNLVDLVTEDYDKTLHWQITAKLVVAWIQRTRVVATVGGGGRQSPPLNSIFSPRAHHSGVQNDQNVTKLVKNQVIVDKNVKFL